MNKKPTFSCTGQDSQRNSNNNNKLPLVKQPKYNNKTKLLKMY